MAYKDLRTFIDQLDKAGELHRIKAQVDWDIEIGAITRELFRRKKGPAVLFENVKDSKIPLFTGTMFGPEKYAMMIDVEPRTPESIIKKLVDGIGKTIAPVMVDKAPCQENVLLGDDIDLGMFPSPRWHHMDGGRFIGTLGCVVTKDPDTGIRNVGVYRGQIEGKNKVGINCEQHGGVHLRKNRDRGLPTPVASCIGVPPAVLLGAAAKVPFGVDEFYVAGGLAEQPIPLVKCKTIDLEVPADAEIILEGYIPADSGEWEMEGPFGEFHGHFNDMGPRKRPTAILTAITFRNHPILQGCSPGVGPNEVTLSGQMGFAAGLWDSLIKAGIPGVKAVNVPESSACFTAVVSLSRHFYKGNAQAVMNHAFAIGHFPKTCIVVDDDIDIYDDFMVQWAVNTRVQPHRDIYITPANTWGCPLDPSIALKDRPMPRTTSSRMGIDATKFFKDDTEFSPLVLDESETIQKVLSRWKEYGFKE
ncbi:MAG: UbiD family decarboxylase [Steroidobacteraceae bacterium]